MRQEYGLIASGTWQTIKAERRKRIPSWSESEARQTILFEFQKNGRIKLYEDKNNNGNPNRKRDILTRGDEFNKSYDKQYYSRKHFSTMSNGKFEIEFEGYENNKGNYEAFYSIRLYPGIEIENKFGSIDSTNKHVDVTDHDILPLIFQPDV